MRISFDIDDTLICDSSVPNEQHVSWWRRWRYPERLRRGTRSLMTALIRRRCKIWIYTSSGRCPRHLKSWFASFGIPIEGVVNLDRHERTVGLRGPSKFPPAFGIDLHVDDSPGVAMEGADHRFPVLVVAPHDSDWVERVLNEVDARIKSNTHWSVRGLAPYQPAIVNIILQYCPDIPHPLRNFLIFQNYFFYDQFLCKKLIFNYQCVMHRVRNVGCLIRMSFFPSPG